MQFADILALLIHDMKNSLGMVVHTIDELTPEADSEQGRRFLALQQEAKRLNGNLIELLTLYKIENRRLSLAIDQVSIEELFEDLLMENVATANLHGVELELDSEPGLDGYFDENLIRAVLNNLVSNGLRYTRSRMRLQARQEEGFLVLRVEDDGGGFPQSMLEAQQAIEKRQQFIDGHTQLGIYFAGLIASMHENRDRKGRILLENGRDLPGGCFSIFLP